MNCAYHSVIISFSSLWGDNSVILKVLSLLVGIFIELGHFSEN